MTRLKTLWVALRARYRVWPRPVQIAAIGLGLGAVVIVVNSAVVAFYNYRVRIGEEIGTHRDRLDHLTAYVARAEYVERERDLLGKRLENLAGRLVPGDTGTLAAAHLQDHVTTIAGQTGVSVQSAQVMREEEVGPYRRVTVRLTLTATTKGLADFLEAIEYGSMQLSVPFLQIDRRGGTVRRRPTPVQEGPRMLSATVEVRGLAAGGEAPPEAAEGS